MKRINPYIYAGLADRSVIPTIGNPVEPVEYAEFLARQLGYEFHELCVQCRKVEVVEARQMIMHILKSRCKRLGVKEIGRIFGNRDHTTVLHALKAVNNHRETERDYRNRYEWLKSIEYEQDGMKLKQSA